MSKHLFLIHGRNFKPDVKQLKRSWLDAIMHGYTQYKTKNQLQKYKNAKKTFVYYGDISNKLLRKHGLRYSRSRDIQDRKKCLNELKKYSARSFNKTNYGKLPESGSIIDDLAWKLNQLVDLFDIFGIAPDIVGQVAPDMEKYWKDKPFASDIRKQLTKPLANALKAGNEVCLVAHSLGSIVAYDVLWKLSHYGEHEQVRKAGPKKVRFITLGSPLGNATVKRYLKSSKEKEIYKYPTLIGKWENFAAEDDYISHEQKLKNHYREMIQKKLVTSITDYHIYNLAVRFGESNPHHGTGYLIHPKFTDSLANWSN